MMSGCLRWFGILLVFLAVCLLSIGGIEAADWLSRVGALATVGGFGDAAAMKAASHFLLYVFLSLPLFVVGLFAMRSSRRRNALKRQESGKPSSAS